MTMTPGVRKLALTAHVGSSVGWLGAVVAFLALAVAGVSADDARTVRSTYVAMDLMGWFVLVPMSVASLLTGLIQSLGTSWGVLRHYWVVVKLLITVVATVVLLAYTDSLRAMARVATDATADMALVRNPSPVLHAGGALALLLVALTLSVYKPQGRTAYGWRKHQQQRQPSQ
jgi:uncharacterized membrane protein